MLDYTYEELKSQLEHSCTLKPLLLVEGIYDIIFYRSIIEDYDLDFEIQKCSGRTDLLKLYRDKDGFTRPTIYCADKDFYIFLKIPKEYKGIIFTKGYSLENDLTLHNKKRIEKKLKSYSKCLKNSLETILNWYAYNVDLIIRRQGGKIDRKAGFLLDKKLSLNTHIKDIVCNNEELLEKIKSNYYIYYQGHLLISIISYVLGFCNKKDSSIIRYDNEQLFDIFSDNAKQYKNQLVKKIEKKIQSITINNNI